MSFFREKQQNNNINEYQKKQQSTIKNKAKSSLQTFNNRLTPRKRVNYSSKRGQFYFLTFKGSLTVEAALILPMFLWVMCFLIYFSKIIHINSMVNNALYNAGRDLAMYSYATENALDGLQIANIAEYGIGNAYVKQSISKELGTDFFEYADINGGVNGINLLLSDYDGDWIDITGYYYVNLPFGLIGGDNKIKLMSKCYMHKWTGYDYSDVSVEDIELFVYITPNGTVYHMNPNCTHIELSLDAIDRNSVLNRKNIYGVKYLECELCKGNSQSVYITNTGTKYHTDKYCSGIKRMVFRVPLSTVGNRNSCSRCGG